MSAPRLLGAVYLALAVLGLAGAVQGIFPVVCLVALLGIGELWLRALTGEVVAPVARIGIATAAGLVSLPLVAVVLHLIRVPIAAHPLAIGLGIVATLLGAVVLLRERTAGPAADPHLTGTVAVLTIPAVLALVVGGAAVLAYAKLPHPAPPGFTSVALNGWAAGIDRPVAIPARGLRVPIRVSSAGLPAAVASVRVRVGDLTIGRPRPMEIAADTTRSVEVRIPAPPNGCLHRIEISVGAASTVFYGRGPAPC